MTITQKYFPHSSILHSLPYSHLRTPAPDYKLEVGEMGALHPESAMCSYQQLKHLIHYAKWA